MTADANRDSTDAEGRNLQALADEHGLRPVGGRPTLRVYLAELWRARAFIWSLAAARAYSRNENTYLGQAWAVLNPLLFAGVYYLVFGIVLDTRGGVDNYVAFLVVGIFIFQFMAQSMTAGANAVVGNTQLIRSLRFPRAALPISTSLSELLTVLPALVVMLIIVTLTGEVPRWLWLALPFVVVAVVVFNAGVAMFLARLVSQSRDLRNLVPLITRVLRYTSGVFFSISFYAGKGALGLILVYQPFALALEVVRGILLAEFGVNWAMIGALAGWGALAIVIGTVYFWRGEGRYGTQ